MINSRLLWNWPNSSSLGNRPFLTILWVKLLDLDGYDNYLQLGESFDNRDQAQAFVAAECSPTCSQRTLARTGAARGGKILTGAVPPRELPGRNYPGL